MQAKKLLGLGSILLTFSGSVVAGVPNESIFSRDFDIGTLTSTPFETAFSGVTNALQHSYTFDLDAPATVEARITNTDLESGYDWDITTLFSVSLMDSSHQVLYKGTTSDYFNGSTIEAVVTGELPAGKDYYVHILGGQVYADGLQYMANISAFPSVVPEPETYAMFLAGLGLMGFMARRKQKNKVGQEAETRIKRVFYAEHKQAIFACPSHSCTLAMSHGVIQGIGRSSSPMRCGPMFSPKTHSAVGCEILSGSALSKKKIVLSRSFDRLAHALRNAKLVGDGSAFLNR